MAKTPHLAIIRFQLWHIRSLIAGSSGGDALNVTKGTTKLYGSWDQRDSDLRPRKSIYIQITN